jgi:hypothetical protein
MRCRSLLNVGETRTEPHSKHRFGIGSAAVPSRVPMLRTAASCVASGADEPRTVALSLAAGRPEAGICGRTAGPWYAHRRLRNKQPVPAEPTGRCLFSRDYVLRGVFNRPEE